LYYIELIINAKIELISRTMLLL